jgi:hypothetical protein
MGQEHQSLPLRELSIRSEHITLKFVRKSIVASFQMLARRTISRLSGMPWSFGDLFTLREINRNVTHNPVDTLPN